MVRLRIRCRCITLTVILLHIFMGIWYFSKPPEPPHQYILKRGEGGITGQNILHLRDQPSSEYFSPSGGELCVREGTVVDSNGGKCTCHPGWRGKRCGIPDVLQKIPWLKKPELAKNLQLRTRAKRIILVAPFTHDFDIFEANVVGLGKLVDVFVVGEVNTTTFNNSMTDVLNHNETFGTLAAPTGVHKRGMPPFLSRLKSGWLKKYQHKIIYVPVLDEDLKDEDSFLETLMFFGLRLVSDLRPDDLLLITSGEEILRRDVTVFLKLFHGYPMPVRCQYRQHLYGFYWKIAEPRGNSSDLQINSETLPHTSQDQSRTPEICALSIHFFSNAFEYKVSRLREGTLSKESRSFLSKAEEPYLDWTIGNTGWRCHLCLPAPSIFHKYLDTPMSLRPKWFSESPSSMLPFIQKLVKLGQDEDLKQVCVGAVPSEDSVPTFIWQHREHFAHLIKNPYGNVSIHNLI